MNADTLHQQINEISGRAGFEAVGVALHDYETGADFELNGDRWFHAASVIKVAILLAVHKAAEDGTLRLDDPLHVRNRFRSAADGSIFRVEADRDADAECHGRIGRTMKIARLAHVMITRSSNLATNLLLDLLGVAAAREIVARAGLDGVRLLRGVEDHAAFAQGLNNEMTARGAVRLFRLLCEGDFLGEASRNQMREVLLDQELNGMLPSRLPPGVRAAHKTGEISTHCHDAGIFLFPNRRPYVFAVFSQGPPDLADRTAAIARISRAIFDTLVK